MRIKVGDRWYSPEGGQSVTVELSSSDRANIAAMAPMATRYAEFHDSDIRTRDEKVAWMDDLVGSRGDIDLQVTRLDVESGDILVVRTVKKLSRAEADAIDAQVSQLARRHGVRDVSVIVLDNATDLTVERPGAVDTRMQHQVPWPAPIVSR